MNRDEIIKAVDEYALATGLAHSTICQYALKNRSVYQRLAEGGSCSIASIEKLLQWMADNPPKGAA